MIRVYTALATILTSAFLASILGSCSSNASDKARLSVVVSVEPQRYILEHIVGDRADITTLMPAGNNPELFEPSIAAQRAVNDCRLYFTTGFFPYETTILPVLTGDTEVVNTSEGIDYLYGTHDHADSHSEFLHSDKSVTGGADPHVWGSVRNVRVMARNMVAALSKADKANADFYQNNLKAFDAHLDSLDRAFTAQLAAAPSHSFMVWHPSLSYFARDYGLEQIAVGAESKETTPREMRRLIDEARADSVRVFFVQPEFNDRQAKSVCSGVDARVVEYSPSSYQWEEGLTRVVDELSRP